jgi:Rrf2 family protein
MLRISDAATLALHSMVFLAADTSRGRTIKEMANELQASEAHLSKVMQRLVKAGFVKSHRGPQGGFKLAKAPSDLSFLDIYEAIDGLIEKGDCLFGLGDASCEKCILGSLVSRINKLVAKTFRAKKLASVVLASK